MLDDKMTIVKKIRAIRNHPLIAIDQNVGDLLIHAAATHGRIHNIQRFQVIPCLKVLEAYCELTNQRITMDTLKRPKIEKILREFCSAVAGGVLVKLSDRRGTAMCRNFYRTLAMVHSLMPESHPCSWSSTHFVPNPEVCKRLSEATDNQRWYWAGWMIKGTGRDVTYLRLAPLARIYGRDYVESIFTNLKKYYGGRPGSLRHQWNNMFDYLSERCAKWPARCFSTETGVMKFMHEFTLFYFTHAQLIGNDAQSEIKSWAQFITGVENCLCDSGVWAKLSSSIKRPPPSTKHGSQTKITEGDNGLLTQEKLLTSIPLHVTDSEAVELLFFHIKNDISVIRKWATYQADSLISRNRYRTSLAEKGTPILYWAKEVIGRHTLADICATLEDPTSKVPPEFLCKVYEHNTGLPCNLVELATHFGLSISRSLFPHQCLLVLEHPAITTDFLRDFELYNEDNQLAGLDKENRLFTGYKMRKSPDQREQTIKLSDIAYDRACEIIEITTRARNILKFKADDAHRHLFLTTGQAFSYPIKTRATIYNNCIFTENKTLRQRMIDQFSPYLKLPEAELVDFIKRVRLSTVRASRAVEIFLETQSTEAMSKALGHTHYYPDLLSHYLPDPILAFIKSRWIRIFQKAIVCEAMKDSEVLLRATHFQNMDELHTFLDNHAIKEIPAQASDPDRLSDRKVTDDSEAIFSIGVDFLTSLLSLEAAVKSSNNRSRVCGKAEYWASLADKIKFEIINGHKRLQKHHLETALKLVDPKKMEKLIYVPSHWI